MTKPIIRKLFKHRNDWAVRIPAHLVPESAAFEVIEKAPGVIELRAISRAMTIRELVEKWKSEPPLEDADDALPEREKSPPRYGL